MVLQTGDLPSWDRPPVAFTKTGVGSQFATFTIVGLLSLMFADRVKCSKYSKKLHKNNDNVKTSTLCS